MNIFTCIRKLTGIGYKLTYFYLVLPYTGLAHLTVQNSSNLVNAARWAEHDLHVTQRKDTEPKGAHRLNSQDVHDPPVNFHDFFNGENLEQEDLVVWFNLGMHHGEAFFPLSPFYVDTILKPTYSSTHG